MSKRRRRYLAEDEQERNNNSTAKVYGVECKSGKSGIWPTELAANLALRSILRRPPIDPDRPQPVRSYACHLCGYWHLTSKPWMADRPRPTLIDESELT